MIPNLFDRYIIIEMKAYKSIYKIKTFELVIPFCILPVAKIYMIVKQPSTFAKVNALKKYFNLFDLSTVPINQNKLLLFMSASYANATLLPGALNILITHIRIVNTSI